MMLNISAMDHHRKLKFSSYVHLPSINKIFPFRYASVILCSVREVIIFEHGCYISALEHGMYKHNLFIYSPLDDSLRCILSTYTQTVNNVTLE